MQGVALTVASGTCRVHKRRSARRCIGGLREDAGEEDEPWTGNGSVVNKLCARLTPDLGLRPHPSPCQCHVRVYLRVSGSAHPLQDVLDLWASVVKASDLRCPPTACSGSCRRIPRCRRARSRTAARITKAPSRCRCHVFGHFTDEPQRDVQILGLDPARAGDPARSSSIRLRTLTGSSRAVKRRSWSRFSYAFSRAVLPRW